MIKKYFILFSYCLLIACSNNTKTHTIKSFSNVLERDITSEAPLSIVDDKIHPLTVDYWYDDKSISISILCLSNSEIYRIDIEFIDFIGSLFSDICIDYNLKNESASMMAGFPSEQVITKRINRERINREKEIYFDYFDKNIFTYFLVNGKKIKHGVNITFEKQKDRMKTYIKRYKDGSFLSEHIIFLRP